MKTNREWVAAAVAVILASTCMTGCGGSSSAGTAATTAGSSAAESSSETVEKSTESTTQSNTKSTSQSGGKITLGSKNFTESFIVSELYALALEDAGYDVNKEFGMSTPVLNEAIQAGEIDLYAEYTGTGLMTNLGLDMITDPDEAYNKVKEEYESQYQITWLEPSEVNDSTCIIMRTEQANELGIKTLSDLQKHASELVLADFQGWTEREDNLPAMNKAYGDFNFKDIVSIDAGLKYEVLSQGKADVIPGNTTEPQLLGDEYTVLEEDIKIWPPYYLAPIVRDQVLEEHPDVAETLNRVSAALNNDVMIKLNSKVDIDGEEYEDVAEEFYNSNIKQQ